MFNTKIKFDLLFAILRLPAPLLVGRIKTTYGFLGTFPSI